MSESFDKDSTRDWPADLKLSAAVDELAVALYQAYTLAYSKPRHMWESLTPTTRAIWRKMALKALKDIAPTDHGAAPAPDPVVNPSAGNGGDSRYFDLAVDITRRRFFPWEKQR